MMLGGISRVSILAAILALASNGHALSAPSCAPAAFTRAPSAEELLAAYPLKARADGLTGRAVLRCAVRPNGTLSDCAVETEDPVGAGFGQAALTLAAKIRASKPCPGAPETQAGGARMTIRFELPKEPPLRMPAIRKLPSDFEWLAPLGPFWPESAVERGLGGEAALDCQVDDRNQLAHCHIVEEIPHGSGFGDAMMAMVAKGWMAAAPLSSDAPIPADRVWRFRLVLAPHRLR